MREKTRFKFRAWCKKRKIYMREVAVGEGFCGVQWEDDINYYYSQHDANLIPEQYTGLKDKNGVEIYDNDRVEGHTGKTGFVYWNEDKAQWWVSPDDTTPNAPLVDEHEHITVVGTTHDQGPELLENKDVQTRHKTI